MSDSIVGVQIRFTRAARRHRIGRASVRFVIAATTPVTAITTRGSTGWWYVGTDERGRELEVLAVELLPPLVGEAQLLVVHVMPTTLRKVKRDE